MSIQLLSPYEKFLLHQFTSIFNKYNDNATPYVKVPLTQPLYADITNRSEILFMQFQMEKKGKNFGIVESRLLKIDDGRLYQVDKNHEQKQIPFPSSIIINQKQNNTEEWGQKYANYTAKIIMKFTQRSDITVLFRSQLESREISMFLLAGIRKNNNKNMSMLADTYRNAVIQSLVNKCFLTRQQPSSISKLKIKNRIGDIFKTTFSDRVALSDLLVLWKAKTLFGKTIQSFSLRIIQFRTQLQTIKGNIKIWAKGTVNKQFSIHKQSTQSLNGDSILFKFTEDISCSCKDIYSDEELQIQFQLVNGLWKSERFTVSDIKKANRKNSILELNLTGKDQIILLKIKINFQRTQITNYLQPITPKYYRVIDQLYLKQDDIKPTSFSTIHSFHSEALEKGRQSHSYYVCFNRFKQLFQMLKIEELIDKFYTVYPFKDTVAQHQGTSIYQHFIKHESDQLYYDVEKLVWKFKTRKYKPILTALKVFDQNPKFNFTEPFFYLVRRMHEIAFRQTTGRWKIKLFSKDTRGIESIAFFLSLAVIKTFPNIFIYQQFVNKRALPLNTLLFVYILQKQLPLIYAKITRIQLNIGAYFGTQFVNLLSNLLQGDTFTRILLQLLQQKKNDNQSMYLYTIVAAFLSIIELIDQFKCTYASAEHYIITLEQICKTMPNKFRFFSLCNSWKETTKKIRESTQFCQLSNDMTEFYLSNTYSGDLGQISQQIYQEFTSYHYKNETDLRKIFILVDKLEIGNDQDSSNLTLSIFQNAIKLYEHQFNGVDVHHLNHYIEIKLIKLQQLNIICSAKKYSYSCVLDPKQVPSNLYFHCAKPLTLTYHLAPECNRYILFQTYIKDNCEVDSLQNPIPIKYRELILERNVDKQDMVFCKKFNRSFRMRENNFNLLYSKLGWFANHYLIPDQRLVNCQILGLKRAGQDQLYSKIANTNLYSRVVYGKAISPFPTSQQRRLNVEIIKQNIHVNYEPTGLSSLEQHEPGLYNSAGRLTCYELDNFYISSEMQFLQFYYLVTSKLPLIRYLSYHPNQFFTLPSFTLQVSTYNSNCTLIISQKGIPFVTRYSPQQIHQIEEKVSEFQKLPEELQFSYTDQTMRFDDFLVYLRLNILRQVSKGSKMKKAPKRKRWPNALTSCSMVIPNYELHHFYELMNQTKQIIQLQFKQSKRLPPGVEYNDFGFIGGRWIFVYCIAHLKTSALNYYYVLTSDKRKKYILNQSDFISATTTPKKTVNLSDDIAHSMEVITYELNQMFDF